MDNPFDTENFIPLISHDKARLYTNCKNSIIIKLFSKSVGHQLIKTKLQSFWRSLEPINLIDLGHAFFLIKFTHEDNMLHVLHDDPWFILGHFLMVRMWEPKFVVSSAQLAYSAIQARLPELPTEYYDGHLLKLVENKLE